VGGGRRLCYLAGVDARNTGVWFVSVSPGRVMAVGMAAAGQQAVGQLGALLGVLGLLLGLWLLLLLRVLVVVGERRGVGGGRWFHPSLRGREQRKLSAEMAVMVGEGCEDAEGGGEDSEPGS
jgi:hypothetical protein